MPAAEAMPPARWTKIAIITGLATFGAGWVASAGWGIASEVGGISCGQGYFLPTCKEDDVSWGSLIIPFVGPFLQLQESGLSAGDKAAAGVLGVFQLAGFTMFTVGLAGRYLAKAEGPPSRSATTLRLAPIVTPTGATLGLTGTF
jgi:hypothetical protein